MIAKLIEIAFLVFRELMNNFQLHLFILKKTQADFEIIPYRFFIECFKLNEIN